MSKFAEEVIYEEPILELPSNLTKHDLELGGSSSEGNTSTEPKTTCVCGKVVSTKNLAVHKKTAHHLKRVVTVPGNVQESLVKIVVPPLSLDQKELPKVAKDLPEVAKDLPEVAKDLPSLESAKLAKPSSELKLKTEFVTINDKLDLLLQMIDEIHEDVFGEDDEELVE